MPAIGASPPNSTSMFRINMSIASPVVVVPKRSSLSEHLVIHLGNLMYVESLLRFASADLLLASESEMLETRARSFCSSGAVRMIMCCE
jgi:hypothetical protein